MIRNLMRLLLSLAVSYQPAPPPPFSARWTSATSATVRFTLTTRACLYREPLIGPSVPLRCYDQAGDYALTFGGPLTDANFKPQAGDIYVLDEGGDVRRARLVSVVYVGVVRR